MKKALLIITSCVLAMVSQAHAGFQFTAPIEKVPQVSIAPIQGGLLPAPEDIQMPSVPMATVEPKKIEDIPDSNIVREPTISTTSDQPKESVWQEEKTSLSTGIMSLPQPVAMPVHNEYDVAVGFGSDLPLVTALRQIIPADYSYVMDKDMEVGQTVSWNGGQEWPIVLENTLAQIGMQSQINGNVVNITSQQSQVIQDTESPIQKEMIKNEVEELPDPVKEKTAVEAREPIVQPMDSVMPEETDLPDNAPESIIPNPINLVDVIEKKEVNSSQAEPVSPQWMALSGQSLQSTLDAWSNLAGVDLFWSSDYDYPLSSDVSVEGEFADAVETLLAGFSQAKPKPMGRLHPNLPNGPAVLIIETQQDTK